MSGLGTGLGVPLGVVRGLPSLHVCEATLRYQGDSDALC